MRDENVLLVLRAEPAEVIGARLHAAGVRFEVTGARTAAERVASGTDRLVLLERRAGWQALILRVENAGGAAILLGPRPRNDEALHELLREVEWLEDVDELLPALGRALERRTRRMRSEVDEVRERLRVSERIAQFSHAIASQLDLPELAKEAVARTRDLCEADGARLLLIDPTTGALCFDTVNGAGSGERVRLRLDPSRGIAAKVAREARSQLVARTQGCPDFDPSADAVSGFRAGSLIAVPLLHRGDVIGVLEAVRAEGRQAFDAGALERLEQLAPPVTVAIHNARVNAGLREAQSAVLQANAELEEKIRARTAQIANAKREWEATFDAIQDPIALQDGFTLRRVNVAYAQRVGLRIQEIPGRRCHELLAGRMSPCPGCPLGAKRASARQAELSLPDGSSHAVSAFTLGSSEAVVLHYRDITGEKRLATRLRESERLAALGQLASGAAHEINNPLGFLASNLSHLESSLEELRAALTNGESLESVRPRLEERVVEGLELLLESRQGAERIASIVKGLRELARQERTEPSLTEIDGSIARAVRKELPPEVSVSVLLASTRPVWSSPLQLDQLFMHVLRNARQAMPREPRIEIESRDAGDFVEVTIRDHGVGIAADHLHRVFEPFFSTRGVGGGVGLGLTAAYGIVRRAGGSIQLDSQPGEGTRVSIRLPCPRADATGSDQGPRDAIRSTA